ncbi:MAG: hypothetical protein ACRDGJ_02965 [Candidatus Limnocylindria bacterium]
MRVVQRATASIADLNDALDRRLLDEQRPSERLRMLRETTNQITRTANDAIQAYRRARAAIDAELQIPGGDRSQARQMGLKLDSARDDVLRALELTSRRYTWAEPWPPSESGAEVSDQPGVEESARREH